MKAGIHVQSEIQHSEESWPAKSQQAATMHHSKRTFAILEEDQ